MVANCPRSYIRTFLFLKVDVLLQTVQRKRTRSSRKLRYVDDFVEPVTKVAYLTTDGTGDDRVYQPEAAHASESLDVKSVVDRIELSPYDHGSNEGEAEKGWFSVTESEHNRIVAKMNRSSSEESGSPSTSDGKVTEGESEDAEVVRLDRSAREGMLAGVPVRRAAAFVSVRGRGRGRGRGSRGRGQGTNPVAKPSSRGRGKRKAS